MRLIKESTHGNVLLLGRLLLFLGSGLGGLSLASLGRGSLGRA